MKCVCDACKCLEQRTQETALTIYCGQRKLESTKIGIKRFVYALLCKNLPAAKCEGCSMSLGPSMTGAIWIITFAYNWFLLSAWKKTNLIIDCLEKGMGPHIRKIGWTFILFGTKREGLRFEIYCLLPKIIAGAVKYQRGNFLTSSNFLMETHVCTKCEGNFPYEKYSTTNLIAMLLSSWQAASDAGYQNCIAVFCLWLPVGLLCGCCYHSCPLPCSVACLCNSQTPIRKENPSNVSPCPRAWQYFWPLICAKVSRTATMRTELSSLFTWSWTSTNGSQC